MDPAPPPLRPSGARARTPSPPSSFARRRGRSARWVCRSSGTYTPKLHKTSATQSSSARSGIDLFNVEKGRSSLGAKSFESSVCGGPIGHATKREGGENFFLSPLPSFSREEHSIARFFRRDDCSSWSEERVVELGAAELLNWSLWGGIGRDRLLQQSLPLAVKSVSDWGSFVEHPVETAAIPKRGTFEEDGELI